MNSGTSRISRRSTPGSDMPSALGLVMKPVQIYCEIVSFTTTRFQPFWHFFDTFKRNNEYESLIFKNGPTEVPMLTFEDIYLAILVVC